MFSWLLKWHLECVVNLTSVHYVYDTG